MIDPHNLHALRNAAVHDPTGELVGTLAELYLNEDTGRPEWITVTGPAGQAFAPLAQADFDAGQMVLAVSKDVILGAPRVRDDGQLREDDQNLLYGYYSEHLQHAAARGLGSSGSGGDEAMIRSEERLHVGTENIVTGSVRLRKYVVTDNVTQTVPLCHEELRLERRPITEDSTEGTPSLTLGEEDHEIVLHAQRPVVAKETVPVERVTLATDTATELQEITETLRTEHIDDLDIDPTDR